MYLPIQCRVAASKGALNLALSCSVLLLVDEAEEVEVEVEEVVEVEVEAEVLDVEEGWERGLELEP